MANYKFIKRLTLLLLIAFSLGSCDAWLDITPSDSITEDELLSTKEGFHQALNGIYLDLNVTSLYGGTLLCSDIEILAQRYAIHENNTNYTELAKFNYKTTYSKQTFQNTWNSAYNLILSINKLLTSAEEKKDMLGAEYKLIRGELLGLRAMLHFDLFRLFGPVLAVNPENKSIPYKTSGILEITPLLSAREISDMLLADLENAATALVDDPLRTQGRGNNPETDNFWNYRSQRMNYYAVKGLKARVALYLVPLNNKYWDEAYEAATAIIKENDRMQWFTSATSMNSSRPDRIFSTEILFMNENIRRASQIHLTFFASSISPENILIPSMDMLSAVYSEEADFRFKPTWKSAPEISGLGFNKYASVDQGISNDMIPMIRLSEMYLIAAETATSQKEAFDYLNTLRLRRQLEKIAPDTKLSTYLLSEYRREFFGEGQLFFYYKRLNSKYMPVLEDIADNINSKLITSPDIYVIPLPDSEAMYR